MLHEQPNPNLFERKRPPPRLVPVPDRAAVANARYLLARGKGIAREQLGTVGPPLPPLTRVEGSPARVLKPDANCFS